MEIVVSSFKRMSRMSPRWQYQRMQRVYFLEIQSQISVPNILWTIVQLFSLVPNVTPNSSFIQLAPNKKHIFLSLIATSGSTHCQNAALVTHVLSIKPICLTVQHLRVSCLHIDLPEFSNICEKINSTSTTHKLDNSKFTNLI